MQIVIDIPDEKYERLVYQDIISLRSYVENGIVLPKGHGKIGDLDRLYNVFEKNVVSADVFKELFDHAPTIIEADRSEEDG